MNRKIEEEEEGGGGGRKAGKKEQGTRKKKLGAQRKKGMAMAMARPARFFGYGGNPHPQLDENDRRTHTQKIGRAHV